MQTKTLKNRYNKVKDKPISLASKIKEVFKGFEKQFNLDLVYQIFSDETKTTLRGRVYRELMTEGNVQRVGKGLYKFNFNDDQQGVIINGDARKLDLINNESVALIVADHPYNISQGGNRSFNSSYKDSSFKYEPEDFKEKSRVLMDGGFLVEFLPEMKESNIEYICSLLAMAKSQGFNFFAKVPWYKAVFKDGKLVDRSANVGRKAVLEDIYIFTKGEPRKLRYRKQGEDIRFERGANGMLPAIFMELCEIPKKRTHKAEKPIELLEKIIKFFTNEHETVLDQFAGSFHTFLASLNTKRKAIAIEINTKFVEEFVEKCSLNSHPNFKPISVI